jgi:hypothetical protein
MNDVDPREAFVMTNNGNEKSQFFFMGKISFECMDWVQSQPKKTMTTTSKKVAGETPPKKLTPPPWNVEGED